MKQSGFGIIELLRNNIPPEAHAMNNSITQDNQNDNQISKTIKRFFPDSVRKNRSRKPLDEAALAHSMMEATASFGIYSTTRELFTSFFSGIVPRSASISFLGVPFSAVPLFCGNHRP